MRRGDIYYVDFGNTVGSEQSGYRPAVIVQNDSGNYTSPTLIVVPLSTKRASLESHVEIPQFDDHINGNSVALCEQIRTIDKQRLGKRVYRLSDEIIKKVEEGIKSALDMED